MEHFTLSGNIFYDVTDHLDNFLIINKVSCITSNVKIYKRDISKFNETDLVNEVQAVDWKEVLGSHGFEPSLMLDSFYAKVSSIIDKHIPIKELSKKEGQIQSKPWITSGIRKSIHKKNVICYQRYLKTKSQQNYLKFKKYRNKINHLIRIS